MVGCGLAQFKISKWMFLCEQGITVLINANGCLRKATCMSSFGYLILDPNPVFWGKDKRSPYFIPYPSTMHQCHSSQTSRDTLSSLLFYCNCPKLCCSHCEARFWGWREIRKSLLRVVLEVPSFSEKTHFSIKWKASQSNLVLQELWRSQLCLRFSPNVYVCINFLFDWKCA